MGPVPVNIARFLSLTSPESPANPAMDDYFSSDLTDARFRQTFGKLGSCPHISPSKANPKTKSMLVLVSGSDEHVNASIDKEKLFSRWQSAVSSSPGGIMSPHSQIVPNALHGIAGESIEARTARLIDMRHAVLSYLDEVGKGPWAIWEKDREEIEAEKGLKGVKL
jgi:hypothetical protein